MSIFSNLTTDITNIGLNAGIRATQTIIGNAVDSGVRFNLSKGARDMYVFAAERTAAQEAFAALNGIYSKALSEAELKESKKFVDQNSKSMKTLINTHEKTAKYKVNNNIKNAPNYLGKVADECLIMWIASDKDTPSKEYVYNSYYSKIKKSSLKPKNLHNSIPSSDSQKYNVDSNIWEIYGDTGVTIKNAECVFMDLSAMVDSQGGNNLVLTKVQGRNYSRKEFISGGDMNFTVTGVIQSNFPDLYPYEEVSKFVKIMQSQTIIQVSQLAFNQLNVSRILIKDWQLSKQQEGCKNIQPYSFTCVGLEPDEDVKAITSDTIDTINYKLGTSGQSGWKSATLSTVKNAVTRDAVQTIEQITAGVI